MRSPTSSHHELFTQGERDPFSRTGTQYGADIAAAARKAHPFPIVSTSPFVTEASNPAPGLAALLATVTLLIVSIHLLGGPVLAQTRELRFERIPLGDREIEYRPFDLAQDSLGFLWFATSEGLYRYDGLGTSAFLPGLNDTAGISSSAIWCLLTDRSGKLWIGTFDEGLDCFDPLTGRFRHFRSDPADLNSISPGPITALHEDSDGALWIGTEDAGVARLDPSRDRVTRYNRDGPDRGRLSNNSINAICQDIQGRVWIATDDGLNLIEPGNDEVRVYRHHPANKATISEDFITCLWPDPAGHMWAGTRTRGINQIDGRSGNVRRVSPSGVANRASFCDSITALYQGDPHHLWVGAVYGLYQLNLLTGTCLRFVHDPLNDASLSSDRIRRIKGDRIGTLWIATDIYGGRQQVSGVNKLVQRTRQFAYHRLAQPDGETSTVQGILEDHRTGITWIGGSHGLRAFHRPTGRVIEYTYDSSNPRSLSDDLVQSLCLDRSGRLWVGTWRGGLSEFQPSTSSFRRHQWRMTDGELGGSAITLCEDAIRDSSALPADVNLWIGGFKEGLIYFSRSQGVLKWYRHSHDTETSLGNDRVLALLVDSRGTVWVGTDGGGLNRFEPHTQGFVRHLHRDRDPSSLRSSSVYSIAEDPTSYSKGGALLWIGTATGLDLFDATTGTAAHITLRDSTEAISVMGLVVDRSILWATTERDGLFARELPTGTTRSFNAQNGLPSNYFTRALGNSSRGEILLGQSEGFIAFFPDSIRSNPYPPPIALTGFNIFDTPYRTDQPLWNTPLISLNYGQDFFSFRFVALDFVDPKNNSFVYQLEGFDEQWNRPWARNFAGYTKVDPGEYVFRVKGANSDGVWNESGTSIRLLIHPPYWRTWWFRALVTAVVLSLLFGAYKYRIARLLEMERMRLRIAGDLHDDIGSSLSGIALVTESIRMHEGLEQRDRERLADVSRTARRTADALRDIVWIVNPEHDSVDDLLLRLKDSTSMILTGIEYSISTTGGSLSQKIPIEFRRNLILIYKEILNNIARHAGARKVLIAISHQDSTFTLHVTDDGQGFDPANVLRGNGLNNLNARAASIGGTLTIKSAPGQGTVVILTAELS